MVNVTNCSSLNPNGISNSISFFIVKAMNYSLAISFTVSRDSSFGLPFLVMHSLYGCSLSFTSTEQSYHFSKCTISFSRFLGL